MALSASTDFILTAQQVLEEALTKIGGYVEGESLSTTTLDRGRRTLNIMLKAMQNRGLHTQIRRTVSVTPVNAQRSYTFGPSGADVTVGRPLKVLQVELQLTSDSSRMLLKQLTHQEYTEKNSRLVDDGNPVEWFYDPTITSGTLYVWPIPDATTAADYTMQVIYRKPFDDIDALADNLEIPVNWYEAVVLGLASRLAHEYPLPIQTWHILRKDAREALAEAEGEETEEFIQFTPDRD